MENSDAKLWPVTLLFDGACPICTLEMDSLRERDTLRRLAFVDIAAPGFDPAPYGATREAMGLLLHAVRPDGSLVIGTDAIRLAYRAVGLGAWVTPTGLPLAKPLFDAAYAVFARNRYGVSRLLAPVVERVAAARAQRRMRACHKGQCSVDPRRAG